MTETSVLNERFHHGLVIGLDVGTAGLGWAVRRGPDLLDLGVLVVPEKVGNLEERRTLRRMRRTIRSRRQRMQQLRAMLTEVGLPSPGANAELDSPAVLRLQALNGEPLRPEELHAALFHLWKHRGWLDAWWKKKTVERTADDEPELTAEQKTAQKEAKETAARIAGLLAAMKDRGCRFACHYLALKEGRWDRTMGCLPRPKPGQAIAPEGHKNLIFPRELLREEFLAIVEAQRERWPTLYVARERILYGAWGEDSHHPAPEAAGRQHRLHGGVWHQRQARFDNRKPGKCVACAVNNVCRADAPEFAEAQRAIVLGNYRVFSAVQGKAVPVGQAALPELADILAKHQAGLKELRALAKTGGYTPLEPGIKKKDQARDLLVQQWADRNGYELLPGQQLTARKLSDGRCAFCRPCLRAVRYEYERTGTIRTFQPLLRRPGESLASARARYVRELRNPLVRQRVEALDRLLDRLERDHGSPAVIVVEAVRSLGLGKKANDDLKKKQATQREEREAARQEAAEHHAAGSQAVLRFRLAKEVGKVCPYCHQPFHADLADAEIEHILPRALGGSDQQVNLTVAHTHCNHEKHDQLPHAAWGEADRWPCLERFAREHFKGLKLQLFLHQGNPEEALALLAPPADLTQTAYIARALRGLCLLRQNWLTPEGRDPSDQPGGPGQFFQLTNGYLTAGIRRCWGLDELLPSALDDEGGKNRHDLRHHALDAAVIACTLPWAAHQPLSRGGWREAPPFGSARREQWRTPFDHLRSQIRARVPDIVPTQKVGTSAKQKMMNTTAYGPRPQRDRKGKETTVLVTRVPLVQLKEKQLNDIYPQVLMRYIAAALSEFRRTHGDEHAFQQKAPNTGKLSPAFVATLHNPGTGRPIHKVHVLGKDPAACREVRPNVFVEYTDATAYLVYPDPKKGRTWAVYLVKPWEKLGQLRASFPTPVYVFQKKQLIEFPREVVVSATNKAQAGKYRFMSCNKNGNVRLCPAHIVQGKEGFLSAGLPYYGFELHIRHLMEALGYGASPPPPAEAGVAAHPRPKPPHPQRRRG